MDCMCRVCETIYGLKNMFDEENEELLLMLRSVANISIDVADSLPKFICEDCTFRLDQAYCFKEECETTDKKLRALILENEMKLEISKEAESIKELTRIQLKNEEAKAENVIQPTIISFNSQKPQISALSTNSAGVIKTTNTAFTLNATSIPTILIYQTAANGLNNFLEQDFYFIKREEIGDGAYEEVECMAEENAFDALGYDNADAINEMTEPSHEDNTSVEKCMNPNEDTTCANVETTDKSVSEENTSDTMVSNDTIPQNLTTVDKSDTQPVEEKQTYYCSVCGKPYTNLQTLATHKLRHKERQYECEICKRRFYKQYILQSHMNSHGKGKRHACNQCGKTFSFNCNLQRHLKYTHNKEKPHVCDVCGMKFSRKISMIMHHARHTNDRNVECDRCSARFRTKYHLQMHVKNVHSLKESRRQYECRYCGKIFKSHSSHWLHEKTHKADTEKPFCKICSKHFQNHYYLRTHMRIHTGERPYKCDQCGKAFRQHCHLTAHIRCMHTSEKQFTCPICDKAFAHAFAVKLHQKVHTGEKPFACDLCPKRFTEKKSLKKHQLKVHPDKSESQANTVQENDECNMQYDDSSQEIHEAISNVLKFEESMGEIELES